MTNRLGAEKSPYLLQHAANPVDWYPWGEEAFDRAAREDRPVFLSIGYATCHWCHVMAHESFEDEEVARVLNQHFISIKLDREERPDIDHLYMSVCQAFIGRGGWPLTVFMTPEKKPFFAGTYYPRRRRLGLPGFLDIVEGIASMWRTRRAELVKAGEDVAAALNAPVSQDAAQALPGLQTLKRAYVELRSSFDPQWGGFGAPPKFPSPHQLSFLLRWGRRSGDPAARDMVRRTLDAMRNGGIFDQIGFGFHRYSVDEKWLVPHFEKMLYDQATLTLAYTEGFQALGDRRFRAVVHEVAEYVLRDLTAPEGGFYCAEDADTEGCEGVFYLWTPGQIRSALGAEDARLCCRFFGISDQGNFEAGLSVPHIPVPLDEFARREGLDPDGLGRRLDVCRRRLLSERERRERPLLDDKILASWNGLMIAALARAGQVFAEPGWVEAGKRAARFCLSRLMTDAGRLRRRFRDGDIRYEGCLDDYAFFVWGLIELYEASFDAGFLRQAVALTDVMLEDFWDPGEGDLFFSSGRSGDLIARPKDVQDGAMPSGTSVAALNLLRLARMTGRSGFEDHAGRVLQAGASQLDSAPAGSTHMLAAVDFILGPAHEIVLVGPRGAAGVESFLDVLHRTFAPNKVVLFKDTASEGGSVAEISPFAGSMGMLDGAPAVYLCQGFMCGSPTTDPQVLARELNAGLEGTPEPEPPA